jgi:hypothetical protein
VAEGLSVLGIPRENGDVRFQHLLFENIAYGCTTVMNCAARELIVSRMPERGVIMHDWWCVLVVAALGRVIYDREPGMILYRQHEGNVVGGGASALATMWRQAKPFLRAPGSGYRIHAQASELLRLFGGRMPATPRRLAERMVESKRSRRSRLGYALGSDPIRNRFVDAWIARGLLLLGWY